MEAVTKIHGMKNPPKAVLVVVTEKGVYVDDKKSKALMLKVPLEDLTYVGLDPRNKKLFSIIVHDVKLDNKQCYTFSVKGKAHEIPDACNKALSQALKLSNRAEAEASLIAAATTIMPVEGLQMHMAEDDEGDGEDAEQEDGEGEEEFEPADEEDVPLCEEFDLMLQDSGTSRCEMVMYE